MLTSSTREYGFTVFLILGVSAPLVFGVIVAVRTFLRRGVNVAALGWLAAAIAAGATTLLGMANNSLIIVVFGSFLLVWLFVYLESRALADHGSAGPEAGGRETAGHNDAPAPVEAQRHP